jgi:DHA1 family inner membrane transport protein
MSESLPIPSVDRAPWSRRTGVPRSLRRRLIRQDARSAGTGVVLAAIAAAAFVLGTAELVVVGVLDLVAVDFDVSLGHAGLLVTTYAIGISVGGPLLAAVTLRFGRTAVMRVALAAYVVGNVVAVAATTFGMVLVARVATGALHGLFIGAAFAVAASVVPRERMGRAISAVFGGGWAVSSSAQAPIALAAVVCAVALPATWAAGRLRPPAPETT